jgi:uncharacterized hydrophobic protein (TIGR00271 family)
MNPFVKTVVEWLNLSPELEDYDLIDQEIRKGIVFKGTNLWILIFAIVVASVGLNMNSTAVIIGAMLISPLMGPINGMGYSVATYDFVLLRKAVKNFSFAVLAGLFTSTIYFAITPVSTAHSELLARTSPTIYDVLIALFGGLAGIVAMSSKQKGNVIPGVAIATALMPPLCTAGYGLATGQFNFFFGAIYLFTINTVFIAIAALWVSQLLKFPIRSIIDTTQKKQINNMISALIIIVLIPSIYFGYNLVQLEKFKLNAEKFVQNVSFVDGNFLVKNEIDPANSTLRLFYIGETLSEQTKEDIKTKAIIFDLDDSTIEIEQGFSTDLTTGLNSEMLLLKEKILQLEDSLEYKKTYIDSLSTEKGLGQSILQELNAFFPEIVHCSVSTAIMYSKEKDKQEKFYLAVIVVDGTSQVDVDMPKVKKWLQKRLKSENVKVYLE